MKAKKNIITLSRAQRVKLKAIIASDGCESARAFFGVARHTLERAALGGTIQRGTAEMLEQRLDHREV